MDEPVGFFIFATLAAVVMVASGVPVVKRLTLALEGHYEFKGDSLTKRSRLAGFMWFFGWLLIAVVTASFFFDWLLSGSVEYAFLMLGYKVEIIFRILAEMGND